MPLGVDELDKSVLSAIAYDRHGKPFNPPHKSYRTWDDKELRNLPYDETYKHIGLLRRLDGVEAPLRDSTLSKCGAAAARLKVMAPTRSVGRRGAAVAGDALRRARLAL